MHLSIHVRDNVKRNTLRQLDKSSTGLGCKTYFVILLIDLRKKKHIPAQCYMYNAHAQQIKTISCFTNKDFHVKAIFHFFFFFKSILLCFSGDLG